jgi:hypothetical protein
MKRFKIAQAGQTIDGREIKAQWLQDIVETYSKQTYHARINIEHLVSLSPNSDFRMGGYVNSVELKTEDGITSLYAELEPNDYAKKLNKDDQKVFASIEVVENFAGTGKAYLSGLALTDEPASLGIEAIKFSKTSAFGQPLTPGALMFNRTAELDLSEGWGHETAFEKLEESGQSLIQSFTQALRDVFKSNPKTNAISDETVAAFGSAVGTEVSNALAAQKSVFDQRLNEQNQRIDELKEMLNIEKANAQAETQKLGAGGRPAAEGGEAEDRIRAKC